MPSIHARAAGVTWIGSLRAVELGEDRLPSFPIALPRTPIAAWPPGPRTTPRSQQICFSATWIG